MLVIRNLFGTGTNCIAPSGLPLLLCLFPGLAPWAFLSRPCGASFAPETSLVSVAKPRTPKGSSRTAQGASPGFKVRIAESPERAAQGVRSQLRITARHKEPLLVPGPTASPLQGFRCYCACSQGLRPGL